MMIRLFQGFMALALVMSGPLSALAGELSVLARPGPWPVADRLIAYQGKAWFSTAVKGVDHNSADIWSFDPQAKELRFERYLFSQDVGHPIVHKGLLYWPHEDMRIGLGAGIVSVTNGDDWRDLVVPSADHMMHTHAITDWQGKLVAAMAGWNSAIAISQDAGKSWNLLVNDAPQSGSFHRYNDLATLENRLFVRHWQTTGLSLAEYRKGQIVPVTGWPKDRYFSRLVRFAGALYTLVDDADGRAELWRISADGPRPVDTNVGHLDMRQLLSDGEHLWIVSRSGDGGQLWSSVDGATYTAGDRFAGGISHSAVALAPGKIYIAGAGDNGSAIIWGPVEAGKIVPQPLAALPQQQVPSGSGFDVAGEAKHLRLTLSELQNYQNQGRNLRREFQTTLAKGPPPEFFASLLDAEFPDENIEIFGGNATVHARDMATWQILAAMALNGDKSVPLRFLSSPWTRRSNRPQKWFDPLIIALHAVQLTGRNDRQTVDTLITRLRDQQDPDWLRSQVTGTLAAITGEGFAYDMTAWIDWWSSVHNNWPENAS